VAAIKKLGQARAEARTSWSTDGLGLALEAGAGFPGRVRLPAGKEEGEVRGRLLRRALELSEKLRGSVAECVSASIAATVAPVEIRSPVGADRDVLSGELLSLTQWAGYWSGVTATSAALSGLEQVFRAQPTANRPDMFHLHLNPLASSVEGSPHRSG